MTKFFKAMLAAGLVAALFFLSIAFVLWEINPQVWSSDARFMFVMCAVPFSLLAAGIASGGLTA